MTETTYRACYRTTSDGQGETVLTGPEHASWDDDALIAEAIAEAERAGIVSADADPDDDHDPSLSYEQLRAGLQIGDWASR